ncbi:RNA-binding protein YhbY [bioreactor metagenome]|uniref:RNA-binding protein YhbY n=1 Tax=bioreactor metagenome TaxID=1076179 RepID=A0A645H409_9ZZZZ
MQEEKITSKQRAGLRAMAQTLQPVVYIGKDGITDNLVSQVVGALEARELVKCSVQQNSGVDAGEACDMLCRLTSAQGVSVLGRKFVLYKRSEQNQKIFF